MCNNEKYDGEQECELPYWFFEVDKKSDLQGVP